MSRQPVPWRTLAKLAVFVAAAVLATIVVTASLLNLSSQPQTGYSALFTDASGLQPGDFVDIAGVQVGTVTGVQLQGARRPRALHGRQRPTAHHDDARQRRLREPPRPAADRARARARRPGRPLAAGAQIPVSRTAPALDLTGIFNGFQPLFAALDATASERVDGVNHPDLPG